MTRVAKKKMEIIDRTPGSKEWKKLNKKITTMKDTITNHHKQIAMSFYKLGELYIIIQKDTLWKFSDIKYKSFTEWCQKEVSCTRQTVYNLMTVVKTLSEDQAVKLGQSLSYAVTKVSDKACRDELIQMTSQGASVTDIKDAMKLIKSYKQPTIKQKLEKKTEENTKPKSTGITRISGNGEVRQIEFDQEKLDKIKESKGKTTIKKVKDDKFTGTIEISGKQVAIEINTKELEVKFWLR